MHLASTLETDEVFFGVICPHDMALDKELWRWMPPGVSLLLNRTGAIPGNVTLDFAVDLASDELLFNAATEFLPLNPVVTAYACTSASFVRGLADSSRINNQITRAGLVEAVNTSQAILEAIQHLQVNRVSVVTPYTADITEKLVSYLAEANVETLAAHSVGRTSEIWLMRPDEVYETAKDAYQVGSDALIISCTNLQTFDLISELERELQVPVISANQATCWSMLRRAGRASHIDDQRLFME